MEITSTSVSLIEQLKRDDEVAWSRLVELYGPLIYTWCRRCHLKPDDAADVSQEVFRAVMRGIGDFRKDQSAGTFRGWLWRITKNKVRDFARARERTVEAVGGTDAWRMIEQLPDLAEVTPQPTTGLRNLLQRALEAIRADFNETTWQAFSKTTFQGHSSVEVANELGLTPNAVRKAKARVLRRLREEIGDVG